MSDFTATMVSLAIGFAFAGGVASGYQLLTARRLSFALLVSSCRLVALAAVPLLLFAAPFVILRNTILGSAQSERRVGLVAVATTVAGLWSLMSGTIVAAGWLELVSLFA